MKRGATLGAGALAIAFGAWAAVRLAWLCDDAFISFRYADHLVRGLGLVYNAGERVEGYTNFLWTVWIALGMKLGVTPERWSVACGIVAWIATLALLLADRAWPERDADAVAAPSAPTASARAEKKRGRGAKAAAHVAPAASPARAPFALAPIACVLVALHPDAQRYASGGLETALFGLLVTAGALLALRPSWGARALAASGAAFALAALTRPDALLFVPLVAAWVAVTRPRRVAALAAFVLPFALVWVPVAAAKAAYYGDWLPNTYYAKSAHLAWWSQGATYVTLYFRRYGALALALPVALAAWAFAGRGPSRAPANTALFAAVLAFAYVAYVMRVGGDFMFARLLVPVAPLGALALERGLDALFARRPASAWVLGALAVAWVALSRPPVPAGAIVDGIADEPTVYTREVMARTRNEGETLRRYFAGQPVTIAIVGSQAALAWYADPATVIEAGAGLTDRAIAHQPLAERGRVGHEKQASVAYLLQRRVDFTLHHVGSGTLDLDAALPNTVIQFDTIPGRIVHWNPALLAAMKARGARFFDLPGSLDLYCSALGSMPDEQVHAAYAQLKAFYFDFVPDSTHERAFRTRLAKAAPAAAAAAAPPAAPR